MSPTPLRVGIIGATGFGGSYLSLELLNRGHTVIGLSRHPEKLGQHARYEPRPVDIDKVTISALAQKFSDIDVLVSEYGPHTAGPSALQYMPFLETVRKLILAYKASPAKYFLFVAGAGSLHVPNTTTPCVDHPDFFLAYRRAISTSLAHIAYMEDRLGVMGTAARAYRSARVAMAEGRATQEDIKTIESYENGIKHKDQASDFIRAGRTAYMFFDGNTSFTWSFVSPPALYRPGIRTGAYEISVDEMVLRGEQMPGESVFEGRLTGISVADMALAIADEVEEKRLVGRHWSAWGELRGDEPGASYVRLEGGEGESK
ncbi:NAD(P)-binding protein [Ophiobolus disseminans]|uniref:NAD(P)-binding protein n=1 Tax=Ophiobolus disseminans TaxID=1469910 RepID=A0A6A7AGG3_9PLEO|nr:NAD(P)-binding protein [Ophiobolus disseminans]